MFIFIFLQIRTSHVISRSGELGVKGDEEMDIEDADSELLGAEAHEEDYDRERDVNFGFKEEDLPFLGDLAENANQIMVRGMMNLEIFDP